MYTFIPLLINPSSFWKRSLCLKILAILRVEGKTVFSDSHERSRARNARCSRTTFEPFILSAVSQQPIFQKGLLNKTCDSKLHRRKEIDSPLQTICARNARPTNKFAKWICKRRLKIRQRNDIIFTVPLYASVYH